MRPIVQSFLLAACATSTLAPLTRVAAQQFDRTSPPRLAPSAKLAVPAVRTFSLANGATVHVVRQAELPLVQVLLTVTGGSRLDSDAAGIATFVANMLDEGAGKRNAVELQSEIAYLGATLNTGADWDRFTVSLKVPVRSLPQALDLMADVVLRPTFAAAEVRRQRDLRQAALLQLRDQPNAVADLAFNQTLFPSSHPYHRNSQGDSGSVVQFDSTRVRTFYNRTFHPSRATFIVVGDINEAQARELLAARFGGWRTASEPAPLPASSATAPPPGNTPPATRLVLVDKPNAAQSIIQIGWPGAQRRSPDYAALVVMNTVLGGSFTSRLNMNLRETKGYTYGAGSRFTFRLEPGPFVASAAVRTNVTDSSLVEFFKELRAIRETPVPDDELARAKAYVELGIPQGLESTTQVASQIGQLVLYGLALEDLPRFAEQVRAVTPADIQRVARQYLIPDRAIVVVVGDLAKIREGIDKLGLGPSAVVDVKY